MGIEKPDVEVAHQAHYESYTIEPIDYMRAIMSKNEFRAYCQGNVIKYITRYKMKGGKKDLEKAQVYLGWMIDTMEG